MTPYLKYDSVSDTESFIMTPYSKYSPLKNIHSWKIFTPEKYSPLKNIHPWTIFTPEKYSPLKNIQYKIFFEGRIRSHNEWLRIRYGWIFDTESSNCAISPLCNVWTFQVWRRKSNLFIAICLMHSPHIRTNKYFWSSVFLLPSLGPLTLILPSCPLSTPS